MKKAFLTLCVLVLGTAHGAFAQAGYPQDVTSPSQAPVPSNPPTNPPPATDNVSSTSNDSRSSSSRVDGGFLLEPMLLTTQQDTSIKTSQLPIISDDTSGTSNGFGVGLRFGGHVSEVLLLGLDARYSKLQLNDSFYNRADSNEYNVAPFVGLQTPYFGVRLLAGYVVAGENNPDAGVQGLNLKFTEANGWRVGAGVHIAAVSVNLEYQDLTYNAAKIESLGSLTANNTTSVDTNSRGYTLSVSFPVEL